MSQMSLVSVIIPTYNSEKFVGQALESVFAQTYRAVEIILVDDGSTDRTVDLTREKLQSESPHPWRIVEGGRNTGPSAARNRGLRVAAGSWVQFLDSDDLLASAKLEHQMAAAMAAPSNVAAIHSPWLVGWAKDASSDWEGGWRDFEFEDRSPLTYFMRRGRPLLAAALVRKHVLDAIGGFDESLRFWECEDVCFRAARHGSFRSAPSREPLFLWRMPAETDYIGSTSAKYNTAAVGLAWIERISAALDGRLLDEARLSDADRNVVLEEATHWARMIRRTDREAFARYMTRLRALHPDFRPTAPRIIALATRIMSYERAETLTEVVRRLTELVPWRLRRLVRRKFRAIMEGARGV